ncbi:MAG: glycoside-pentoside-hexuronide (GPH):cation symporter [Clostridiaceae bacterium]|jgi:melibiose permease/lactose/raffinose/galactose permease|nr:glycoside-pentoside-hexuronide (GPH):cation symporter [Clostridiaceae bacterium]
MSISAKNKEAGIPFADTLSPRSKWSYCFGGVGRDMAYALFSGSILTFILFTKSITDAQFAVLSIIIVACRIWDGFNDPIMGGIIENTRGRLGKFKPWLAIGALTNAVVLVLIFVVPLSGWAYIIFFGFMYLLWDITYTMNDIAYWSMLPALTSNAKQRNSITSLAIFFAGGGGAIAGLIIPMFTVGNLAIGGNAVTAYAVIAVIISIAFLASTALTFFGVKEKSITDSSNNEKIGVKRMIKILFKNDQLLWTALIFLLYNVGNTVIGGMLSMYIYFEFGYNGTLAVIFGIISGAVGVVAQLLFPMIAAKFTRQQITAFAMMLAIVGYIAFFLTGIAWTMNFYVLAVTAIFFSLGHTLYYMVLTISTANTVEYNEWKTGSRDEGIIYSVRPFMAKMGSALQQLVIMLVYLAIGVTVFTNGISEAERSANLGAISEAVRDARIAEVIASVPDSAKLAMRACMCFISLGLVLISGLIYKRKVKLDEKTYAAMVAEINERKAAANGNQSEADGTETEPAEDGEALSEGENTPETEVAENDASETEDTDTGAAE